MFILDTNVISELMRADPEPRVATWALAHAHEVSTTVINQAEILAGIELMPKGRRQDALRTTATTALARFDAVIPLIDACTVEYARIVADRQRVGRPIDPLDALIASICSVADAVLATRNVRDFEGIGLDLINPWD